MIIEDYISKNKVLPVARKHRGKNYRAVRLSALYGAKAALYTAFTD
jgi:hypothetical protein